MKKSGVIPASLATWSSSRGCSASLPPFGLATLACAAFCFFHSAGYGLTRVARQGRVRVTALAFIIDMKEFAREFYSSKAWQHTRAAYKRSKRGLCEICLAKGIIKPAEIVHHKIELTPDNIHDPTITLSFDNLQCVCRDCHATIHDYYGRDRRYKLDELGRVIVL